MDGTYLKYRRFIKEVFHKNTMDNIGRKRPRVNWTNQVEEDLRSLGVRRWLVATQDRTRLRNIVN